VNVTGVSELSAAEAPVIAPYAAPRKKAKMNILLMP
jgi:hypothetical protein